MLSLGSFCGFLWYHKTMNSNVSKLKLYIVAFAFTFSIGFSFFGIKKCIPYGDTLTILSYRYVAALLGVIVWIGICKAMKIYPETPPGRPKGKLYQTAIFYILFMILQIFAMYFATSVEGAIVYAIVPIFAKVIGRIVLGERSTRLQMFFMVMTVSALVLLIILNAASLDLNATGLIIMIFSCFFMACQNVSARYIRGVFAPVEITKTIAVLGAIVFIGASLVRAAYRGSIGWLLEPLYHLDFVFWAGFLGVFCILLSAQFMAYMLAHMEIIQSSIFNSASTLVSIIAGILILGEPLYWYHYVCGAIIFCGVIGMILAPADANNAGKSLSDDIRKKK